MNVIVLDCGNYIRLLVEGRVDTNTSAKFHQEILSAFQRKRDVVADFLNVSAISGAGFRALLIGQKTAVFGLTENVQELSGFNRILPLEQRVDCDLF